MKCNYCSRELNTRANFCTYCGSMLQQNPETDNFSGFVPPALPLEAGQLQPGQGNLIEPAEVVYPRESLSFRTVNYGPRRHVPTPGRR